MNTPGRIRLGRILGIEIALHYSWFLIALLLSFSLAAHVRHVNPAWSGALAWGTAAIASALFFGALLAHELAHSLVAQRRGLRVRSITLFALGGVSDIETEPRDARTEFWMAIVGPATSLLIGVAALGLARAVGWAPPRTPATPALVVLTWLGYINVALAAFNLVPGFPLDGGRVLRAVVWWITGDGPRATRIATRAGQVAAVGFMVLGIVRFFGGAGVHGLWLVFIGWFLLQAASGTRAHARLGEAVRGLTAADLMDAAPATVDARVDLQAFVEDHLFRSGRRCFVVTERGEGVGIVTPHEVQEVDRSRWRETLVRDVMRPLDRLQAIAARAPATEAIDALAREDVNQLAVLRDGSIVGLLSRGHVLGLIRTRMELGGLSSSGGGDAADGMI